MDERIEELKKEIEGLANDYNAYQKTMQDCMNMIVSKQGAVQELARLKEQERAAQKIITGK